MSTDTRRQPRLAYVSAMAAYNAWMNDKVYAAAARLPKAEVMRSRGAYFDSIFGTLSHVVVADTIWLLRFASDPALPTHAMLSSGTRTLPRPERLDEQPCADLPTLAARRHELDALVQRWVAALDEDTLAATLHYANMRGDPLSRELFFLLMHFFNHQTHHRGQVTTLLTQCGEDVGATDLVAMPPIA